MKLSNLSLAALSVVLVALVMWLALQTPQLSWARGGATGARSIDDEMLAIANELQCPVCENQTVAFSPSQLAEQMRGIIKRKLEAGESREQILQYFVDRYGETILSEPPKQGLNLLVWTLPFVTIAVGAAFLGVLLRGWLVQRASRAAEPFSVPPEEAQVYEERLEEELRRFSEEDNP